MNKEDLDNALREVYARFDELDIDMAKTDKCIAGQAHTILYPAATLLEHQVFTRRFLYLDAVEHYGLPYNAVLRYRDLFYPKNPEDWTPTKAKLLLAAYLEELDG